MNQEFTFADLCAGIGGFRLGLEKLGGQCLYSCDADSDCEKTYFKNYGDRFDKADVNSIRSTQFPTVDVLCVGFPCQPFSIAGKREGFKDERGNVFFKIASLTKDKQPKLVFLENVTNLTKIESGAVFREMIEILDRCGYNVHYDILDSANFGVPQTRKRVYILGIRKDLDSFGFQFTKKRSAKKPFRSFIEKGDDSIPISDKWNTYIDLYTGKIDIEDIKFEVPKTRTSLERSDPHADLENCIFQMRSSGIRALSIDKPLPTFAVSISGGGAMIPVYSKERRHLSLVEMKRLMGFPDDFAFPVSRTNAIKQLANAVCPIVIESIGMDFLNFLGADSFTKKTSVGQYV